MIPSSRHLSIEHHPAEMLTLLAPDRRQARRTERAALFIHDQTEDFCIEYLLIKYEPDVILQMNI